MKQLILSIFILCSMAVFGQNNEVAKIVIAIANEKDTIRVEHFDARNNLVFKKHCYRYNEYTEISTYSYNDNNKMIQYVHFRFNSEKWFIILFDYEYDTVQKIKKTFLYNTNHNDFNDKNPFLFEINNTKDLEELAIFQEAMKQNRYMSEISYFRDTLPIKIIALRKNDTINGDTIHIIDYTYNNNLLILEHFTTTYGLSNKTFYTYDALGRILSVKPYVFENKKLDHLSKYKYKKTDITIKRYYKGKVISTTIEEYKENLLVKKTDYYFSYGKKNTIKKAKFVTSYEYDEQNRLIRIFGLNYTDIRNPYTIKYIYITK